MGVRIGDPVAPFLRAFREREHFSLEYREIRSSAGFGTRRRNALRGEGFAWVSDLGSFFKLLEVVFSPYLSFLLSFKCFTNVSVE